MYKPSGEAGPSRKQADLYTDTEWKKKKHKTRTRFIEIQNEMQVRKGIMIRMKKYISIFACVSASRYTSKFRCIKIV